MNRALFAAGLLNPSHPYQPNARRIALSRSYTCPIPECAEPDGITVELHWDRGIGELGILSGWSAGNVVTHCGCTLTAREVEDMRTRAEEDGNGY